MLIRFDNKDRAVKSIAVAEIRNIDRFCGVVWKKKQHE